MSIYRPTPGRTFNLCVLNRWDFNFCVRTFPLRDRFLELATKWEELNGKQRLARDNIRHTPSKTPVGVLFWTCRGQGKRPSRLTGGQRNHHKWLASRKYEVLRSLRHYLRSKAKDITPSIDHVATKSRTKKPKKQNKKEALDHPPRKDKNGSSSGRLTLELFPRQHGGNSWRRSGAHMVFPDRLNTI